MKKDSLQFLVCIPLSARDARTHLKKTFEKKSQSTNSPFFLFTNRVGSLNKKNELRLKKEIEK